MGDLKFVKGEREYIEFEEVIEFEYKGKLYERVMYSSNSRDIMNEEYIREKDGERLKDDYIDDDLSLGDVEEWINENVKEKDIEVYGLINR